MVAEWGSTLNISANREAGVAVIGRACRLPGAPSVDEFWSLLAAGRCSVSHIPHDRWAQDRFLHPRRGEPGKTYTWAAGVLDDIWGFDASAFGISPREAEQMDPQQRLLLELVWEALEDAGVRPSSMAGSETGVFVGASSLDHGNSRLFDVSSGDAYFATGNTLSLMSNRISHAFDLRGPSMTIDTACSSSLVALHEAVAAIRAGRIDTAIVAGVNILASPFSFISFSQASMLSTSGLCRAFDARADGYVRSEGGVVFVLRSLARAISMDNPLRGMIADSAVNSDGRTVGIAMPSRAAQSALLARVYRDPKVDPERLAFIEAHGTGTRVGDPAEAMAIGETLGKVRSHPLPIGSVKTNIGHLEPAAGLAGTLKAMLALEHNLLPASLHFDEPNPDIPFEDLNLAVCKNNLRLPNQGGLRYAGVNSFGFGGTNAHVIISDPPARQRAPDSARESRRLMVLSAHTRAALVGLSARYASRLAGAPEHVVDNVAAAAAHRRDCLPHRLVLLPQSSANVVEALKTFAACGTEVPGVVVGTALARNAKTVFVYSGNGCQFVGMGQAAYESSREFRARFDEVDERFAELAGWHLKERLFAADLTDRLRMTSVAQPLVFAIQTAITAALRALGLEPAVMLGHSVGEIAAAEAAGILEIQDAIRVIHFRSLHQETTRGRGRMAVIAAASDQVKQLIARHSVEIAAFNSSTAVTISGPAEAVAAVAGDAGREGFKVNRLDLDYPFHSQIMDPIRESLMADLECIAPHQGELEFISTVKGAALPGSALDGSYWWRNVREPVRFGEAVHEAAKSGGRVFLEIGPRPTLLKHITASVETFAGSFACLGTLDRSGQEGDPFPRIVAVAHTRGAEIDMGRAIGKVPGAEVSLPHYPWQRQTFRWEPTCESLGVLTPKSFHPLIGSRLTPDSLEWRNHIDPDLWPDLADHRIGNQILMPGAALVEMAWAAAREWLGVERASVVDLEIIQPMWFPEATTRELLTRISPVASTIQILSRPRFSRAGWELHATAKVRQLVRDHPKQINVCRGGDQLSGPQVYNLARLARLQFGPSFQQVDRIWKNDTTVIAVDLLPGIPSAAFNMDPKRLDACFHGLISLFADSAIRHVKPYIPIRFGEATVFKPGCTVSGAQITVKQLSERAIIADFVLIDDKQDIIAILQDGRFQAAAHKHDDTFLDFAVVQRSIGCAVIKSGNAPSLLNDKLTLEQLQSSIPSHDDTSPPVESLLLEGWATVAAYRLVRNTAGGDLIDIEALISSGRLAETATSWFVNLLYALEASNLAVQTDLKWRLARSDALGPPEGILRTLAQEHPNRATELLMASHVTNYLRGIRKEDCDLFADALISSTLNENHELGGASARAYSEQLGKLLESVATRPSNQRALNVLQIGHGPLSNIALRFVKRCDANLTILEIDAPRRERTRFAFGSLPRVELVASTLDLEPERFDLVISAGGLSRGAPGQGLLAEVERSMAARALLVSVEPPPSLFDDLIKGLDPTWFGPHSGPEFPMSPLRGPEEWYEQLKRAGLTEATVKQAMLRSSHGIIVLARKPASPATRANEPRTIRVIVGAAQRPSMIAASLAGFLALRGITVTLEDDQSATDAVGSYDDVVYFGGFEESEDSTACLRDRCLGLKRILSEVEAGKTIWVVCYGAVPTSAEPVAPMEGGFWSFTRTASNEFSKLKIRCIDLSARVTPEMAASRISELLLSRTEETEVHISPEQIRAVRIGRLQDMDMDGLPAAATRLTWGNSLDNLRWAPAERAVPAAHEIEISVEAIGLNFRDLMLATGLLPEDIFENDATLGVECVGRIVRVGTDVHGWKINDRVMAFAPSAFSDYVTIDAALAWRVPNELTPEAAATIPVAFATAYHALITLGKLRRGQWVLIHGGAGGLGLAAIQIARWRGGRVIASAGTAEKRALLEVLGAHHTIDSRAGDFEHDIQRITGSGVDLVLNSLAGEAMDRSIRTLKSFGRFVELGKRDYVLNTHIGLRPFHRNLTYHGVDLDQLLRADVKSISKTVVKLTKLFEARKLTALPYQSFASDEVIDAFRLMQQSGHIGKIVITPPATGTVRIRRACRFTVNPNGTHLITGGLGGFGIQVAKWLARRGARHLVLAGRRVHPAPDAEAVLAELSAGGIAVRIVPCDVSNRSQVQTLLRTINRSMPPLCGVTHCAMVLDDSLIENLDATRLDNVLRPKVAGAENLDQLTRTVSLDYFVMFSSATTFIGNPGQAAYVAANGYLEGLARRRRSEGLAALAISWGAISDVGVLAANRRLAERLAERVGVQGIPAVDALDMMADALGYQGSNPEDAVMCIAKVNWTKARAGLPLLASPTYSALARDAFGSDAALVCSVDLGALIEREGLDAAKRAAADVVIKELSRVLRMPAEDIAPLRPLSELGIDSLMAAELGKCLEARFGIEKPILVSLNGLSVSTLAAHIVEQCKPNGIRPEGKFGEHLVRRHLGQNVDAADLAVLSAAVQNSSIASAHD